MTSTLLRAPLLAAPAGGRVGSPHAGRAERPTLRAAPLIVAVLGAAFGAAVLVLGSGRADAPIPTWLSALAGGSYLVAAVIAHRRGAGRTALLMAVVGVAWFAADLDVVLRAAPAGFLVHLLLAVPDGRLRTRLDRALVATAHLVACGLVPLGLPVLPPALLQAVGAVAVPAVLAGHWLRATPPARRVLGPGYAVALVGGTAVLAVAVAPAAPLLIGAVHLTVLALPPAMLAGTALVRPSRAALAELLQRLPHTEPAQVQGLLQRALGDPSLRIVRRSVGGAVVDDDGRPVDPGAAALTALPRLGSPAAFLMHDPMLVADRRVLDAVAAAAALALDNRLLAAEVRTQLAQVRASRARVVAAADEGRRRIERDLHDGAQQHLVTVALVLRMARDRLADSPGSVDGLLERVADGLDAALVDLRELARGIHPAVLTEAGLLPALRTMAARSLHPVHVVGPELDADLPPQIAATAYFVAAEAVTNAAKHAAANRVHIQVRRAGDRLLVTVADDGIGGADPERGTGLAGLRDRVAAVDGELTVHSTPGAGTSVHADLPMELP